MIPISLVETIVYRADTPVLQSPRLGKLYIILYNFDFVWSQSSKIQEQVLEEGGNSMQGYPAQSFLFTLNMHVHRNSLLSLVP